MINAGQCGKNTFVKIAWRHTGQISTNNKKYMQKYLVCEVNTSAEQTEKKKKKKKKKKKTVGSTQTWQTVTNLPFNGCKLIENTSLWKDREREKHVANWLNNSSALTTTTTTQQQQQQQQQQTTTTTTTKHISQDRSVKQSLTTPRP